MLIDLKEKVGIVTGAAEGIGREICMTLAREGVKVAALDVAADSLSKLSEELVEESLEGIHAECDVRDAAQIDGVIDLVIERYGRIDILVNNAGVLRPGPVDQLSEEDWDLNIDSNLKGCFLMSKAVIPQMKRQRSGRIINAASFAAVVPAVTMAGYASAKAGVVYLTRVLAGELGPWDITVNCYAPGMVPTGINNFSDLPPEGRAELLDTLSLRRFGEKIDVANLVCFLASDLARYITGSLIDVSGGKLATQIPVQAYRMAEKEGVPFPED